MAPEFLDSLAVSRKQVFSMVDRSPLSVFVTVLAISLFLGATGCGSDSGQTGSGASTDNELSGLSYSGSTSNTAIVSWMPPTQRTDGTALTDLAGYRVYYGKSLNAMTRNIDVRNPGQTSQFIDELDKGTWYFAVTAYTSGGLESEMSEIAAKRVL